MKNKTKSTGGSLGYLTKEGFRNLKVNKLMTIASITVLFSSMFLMGIAFMIYRNIDAIVTDIEQENVILVYIAAPRLRRSILNPILWRLKMLPPAIL